MTKPGMARRRNRVRILSFLAVAVVGLGSIGLGVATGKFTKDSETRVIPYDKYVEATGKCGEKHVNFGGFNVHTEVPLGGPKNYTWPASMGPKGGDTDKWSVSAEASWSDGGKVSSYAYCKGGKEPKVVRNTKIVLPSAGNDEYRNVQVSCPAGRIVIGGGWAAQASTAAKQHYVDIMGLQATSKDTWQVSVVNYTGGQQRVTAIALCGKGGAPKEVKATQRVPPLNTNKTVRATCPSGKDVVFGGFQGDYDNFSGRNAFIFSFSLTSDREITVKGGQNLVSGNNQSSKLTAIAYCR
ncbi:MAG TPA: hypothetical protein VH391_07195 [Solirubrobacterales bacterium]